LLLFLLSCFDFKYVVRFEILNDKLPIISSLDFKHDHAKSIYKWNYNSAVIEGSNDKEPISLLVRCQNQSNPKDPYSVTASVLAVSHMKKHKDSHEFRFSSIESKDVIFVSKEPYENYGVEDPRIVRDKKTGTYYMLYSAVQDYKNGTIFSRLALATSKTPTVKDSWVRHGPLFPNGGWSKSGAMLIRDTPPHYLIYGDTSDNIQGLQVATSDNLLNWTMKDGTILDKRKDKFDSDLVEAGPMPLPISDGNYLFIYNSARKGYPSVKPNWDIQYNVGYAILDKTNPLKVLQRSDSPIISPMLPWEKGTVGQLSLTPNVVFCEGWSRIPNETNSFFVYYGGADSVMGVGKVSVKIV